MSALAGHGRLWFVSPQAFLARPTVWLDVMTRVRATHTASPDFGYDLVARRAGATPRSRWDLSALRVAMSAAERVRHETIEVFAASFQPSGFVPAAMCPAYGLAEHTVGVTVGGRAVRTVDGRILRGCGAPLPGVALAIVDPDTERVVPDGTAGEIWVASPSVSPGYVGADDAVFHGQTVDRPGQEFLRTGDLGFLADGELVPTGRLKDRLVIRGVKIHPEDVEDVVRGDVNLRSGGVAVFGVPGPASAGERVVLVAEVRDDVPADDLEAIAAAARARVREAFRVPLHAVVLGGRGLVLRTTSGKPRRSACRDACLAGTLAPVRYSSVSDAPLDDTAVLDLEHAEAALRPHVAELVAVIPSLPGLSAADARAAVRDALGQAVARAGGLASIDPFAPLRSLGLDSAAAVDLAQSIEVATGCDDVERLLIGGEAGNIDGLAAAIVAHLRGSRS